MDTIFLFYGQGNRAQRAYKNIHMASFQFPSGIRGKLRPRPGSDLSICANVINCLQQAGGIRRDYEARPGHL